MAELTLTEMPSSSMWPWTIPPASTWATARTLYVLDADTLALLGARPDADGYLTLDPVNGRLYGATGSTCARPRLTPCRVVVLDTATGCAGTLQAELAPHPRPLAQRGPGGPPL
ncbi:MAG: hypothetical protein R2854_13250 [Caldilineaceae bacterium]